jgi:hypothetical protein
LGPVLSQLDVGPLSGREVRRNRWLIGLTILWAVSVTLGLIGLWKSKLAPAPIGKAPSTWPDDSAIPRSTAAATLVMLAHPKCPCTRASLHELAALMSENGAEMTAQVLFLRPRDAPYGWEESDTWRQAVAIPGVAVAPDDDGAEARRFGATASGHTVVYDKAGHLLFQGGITNARGHAGGNVGRDRVLSLVTRGSADRRDSPTFGCELGNEEKGASYDGQPGIDSDWR